jgi:hypothetical protein
VTDSNASAPPIAPAAPTLADQVAAVDAIKVASEIAAQGKRRALAASTADIIAMAMLLTHLVRLADLTFDMLFTADALESVKSQAARQAIADQVRAKIFTVAGELEALGYGVANPTITATEKSDDEKEA